VERKEKDAAPLPMPNCRPRSAEGKLHNFLSQPGKGRAMNTIDSNVRCPEFMKRGRREIGATHPRNGETYFNRHEQDNRCDKIVCSTSQNCGSCAVEVVKWHESVPINRLQFYRKPAFSLD